MNELRNTVGMLYCGEMGASLAALLMARGVRVVTMLRDRSDDTARRCRAIGATVLDSIGEVIAQSDIVISVVLPDAAEEIAEIYCALAHRAPANAIYVDLNSIGPELAAALAGRIRSCGRAFVDGAVNGLAKNLAPGGTLFLSGPRCAEIAQLIGDAMRVRLLGDEYGRASAMKMLLSGLSKGVCALFAETALIADRRGMLDEMIQAYALIYPGIMTLIERMFPTYAQHAARRAAEMRELEATARATGIEPCTLSGARELHEQLAAICVGCGASDLKSLIEFLVGEGFLEPSKVV